jgi:hypothetical protein
MRTFWALALVLAVPAACVIADEPADRIVPEGTAIPLVLLRQKSVQEELKLSADTVMKIMEFTEKQWKTALAALKQGADERKAKFDELDKEDREFLDSTLTPEQRKRLDQITIQMTGLMQLTRPEVIKALDLTEDQLKEIRQMQQEARKEVAEILQNKDRAARHEQMMKRREATREKIMALLTAEQREKVKELVGAPFKGEIRFEDIESDK